MGAPATVGIDDDFSSSDTGVTLGTPDDETTRGLNVVDGLFIKEVGWDNRFDDLFQNFCAEVFGGDFLGVLS